MKCIVRQLLSKNSSKKRCDKQTRKIDLAVLNQTEGKEREREKRGRLVYPINIRSSFLLLSLLRSRLHRFPLSTFVCVYVCACASNTERKSFQGILTKKTDLLDISFLLIVDITAPSSMQKRMEQTYSSVDGYTHIHTYIPKTNHPH